MQFSVNRRTVWLLGFLISLASTCVFSATKPPSPEEHMEQGYRSFQRGDFEAAVSSWTDAARLYGKDGKFGEVSEALTGVAQAYQSLGLYQKALERLEVALALARRSGDRTRIASVLNGLGNTHIAIGPEDKARSYLNEALGTARELEDLGLSADILNNLGNLLASQRRNWEASEAYQESMVLASKTDDLALASVTATNAAMVLIEIGQHDRAKALLDKAFEQIRSTSQSHEKAYGFINIGLGYHRLRPHLPDAKDQLLLLAFKSFKEAKAVAKTIDNGRALSYSCGYLGNLYEEDHRYEEALQLTRRASFAAQQVDSPQALYRWQWQTGRLLKALGKTDEAILAHRRAVDTLQSIRQELSVAYGVDESSFRQSVGPLYLELVDLLLKRAAFEEKPERYEPYLREARERMESLKVSELRDYFRDECVAANLTRMTTLDAVSKTAVVIYPILLSDRTELLVSFPSGLKRFSVAVGADTMAKEVNAFRLALQEPIFEEGPVSEAYLSHAHKLYDWLIRPLESDLSSLKIDTLVFVPDGPLRTIPMAPLHDGKGFLVKKWSLAITPGLNLTDPRPLDRKSIRVLAAGLTKASQGFPPLPYVAEEIQTIHGLFGGKVMLNQEFVLSNLEEALLDQVFNVVHIASHAEFRSDIEKTFLLTFDDKLTLDRLDKCVGFLRYREQPLELLTLSACESAAGDDRAALGLAGVAVKAGAKSALATLWSIHDEASSILVTEFYRQLGDQSVSKAVALQRAQLKLLSDPGYAHPAYWSPFVLINNWL